MQRDYTVKIAGREHRLRYELAQRDEIEQAASVGGTVRSLMDVMASGRVRDQALVVLGGIQGASRNGKAKLSARDIIDAFQAHNDKGGDYYQDVLAVAYAAISESGLLGRDTNTEELKRLFGFKDAAGKEDAADAPPESVRAAE